MQAQMRADLKSAMKARDRTAVAALRTTLAAIANAEALPADDPAARLFAGEHVTGAGATEQPRRLLTDADVRAVVEREIHDRTTAAASYDELGRADLADPLRAEADVLTRYLRAR
jgi:uncharacterized protein